MSQKYRKGNSLFLAPLVLFRLVVLVLLLSIHQITTLEVDLGSFEVEEEDKYQNDPENKGG